MTDTGRLIRDDARRRYGGPPDPGATWARLAPHLTPRAGLEPRRHREFAPTPLATALGMVLLVAGLLAAGVVIAAARPAPVGAAAIIARAGRAAGPGGSAAVTGYRGTASQQYREMYTPTDDPAAAPLRTGDFAIWFRAPGSWRIEAKDYLAVTDGATCWTEDGVRRRVFRVDLARCDLATELGPADPGGLAGADGRGYAARRGADTAVAGRDAYTVVVTLDPLPVPTTGVPRLLAYPPSATNTIVRTLWIDRETYLVLGTEDRDAHGTLLNGWAFTTFALDPPDPALFTYAPPPGYAVIDQRRPATPTP